MKTVRAVLAVIVSISSFPIFFFFWKIYSSSPDLMTLVKYDDYKMLVSQMVLGDFDRFFNFGILVLAGIWSLAIVRKDERLNKNDWPETSRVSAKPAMRGHFKTGHSRPGTLDVVPIAALFCKSHF
jgi:hypothetical protein